MVVVGANASKPAAAVVWPVPPLAMATVPVTLDAVPVVFWFSVGTSAATKVRNVGVPATPFGAAKKVLAVCDAKFEAVTANVPPSVKLPDVVTVPVNVSPLTVPVPPTEVTVPVLLVYPFGLDAGYAPKLVKAVAAVVAPVPPFATATVPVTFDAVPVVFWFNVGKSAATAIDSAPVVVVDFRMPVANAAVPAE